MFTIPEGEIELIFRGKVRRAAAGSTMNVPANAAWAQERVEPAGASALHVRAGWARAVFALVGDPVDSRAAASPVLGKDERAERVNTQKRSRPNIEPSRHREGLCSVGAAHGRANAELVKLIAPISLRSAPKLVPLARRGVLH